MCISLFSIVLHKSGSVKSARMSFFEHASLADLKSQTVYIKNRVKGIYILDWNCIQNFSIVELLSNI